MARHPALLQLPGRGTGNLGRQDDRTESLAVTHGSLSGIARAAMEGIDLKDLGLMARAGGMMCHRWGVEMPMVVEGNDRRAEGGEEYGNGGGRHGPPRGPEDRQGTRG